MKPPEGGRNMFDLEKAIAGWRQQMAAAGIESSTTLDELESHLREDVAQQIRKGLDPERAFESAIRCLGEAGRLRQEYGKIGNTQGGNMINHNRVYSILLSVFALYNAVVVISGFVLLFIAGGHWNGPLGHAPEWLLPWLMALTILYTVAMFVTSYARRFHRELGRKLTRWLNWALLPALPGGTLLGLYGLWKADRETPNHNSAVGT